MSLPLVLKNIFSAFRIPSWQLLSLSPVPMRYHCLLDSDIFVEPSFLSLVFPKKCILFSLITFKIFRLAFFTWAMKADLQLSVCMSLSFGVNLGKMLDEYCSAPLLSFFFAWFSDHLPAGFSLWLRCLRCPSKILFILFRLLLKFRHFLLNYPFI